jgi:hypothetical protein
VPTIQPLAQGANRHLRRDRYDTFGITSVRTMAYRGLGLLFVPNVRNSALICMIKRM